MYGRPGLSNFLYFRIYHTQHTAFGLVRVLAAGRRERAENKIPRSRHWEQLRMSESDDVRDALRMRHAPRRVVVGRHVAAQKLCSRARAAADNQGTCVEVGFGFKTVPYWPCASSAAVSRAAQV